MTAIQLNIPGYEVMDRIGEGANAVVYLARHLKLDRLDAIKVLKPRLAGNEKFVAKLESEGRTAARLRHENIVTVYDVMSHIETPCMVMEYVEGGSLTETLQREGKLPERLAIQISMQIVKGLRTAHAAGLVHCDIKPSNILADRHGRARIVDFGLARSVYVEVKRRGPSGTPLYSAPEQIRGDAELDPRTDFYNLGATMYHMVTGRPPFLGKTPDEVMRQHLVNIPQAPDQIEPKLSSGLCRIIETLLAKDPDDRYGSADQLYDDLKCVLSGNSPIHVNDPQALMDLAQIETDTKADLVRVDHPIFTRPVLMVLLALSMALNIGFFIMMALGY